MKRSFMIALLVACVSTASAAEARPLGSGFHPRCNIDWPCVVAPSPAYHAGEKIDTSRAQRHGRAVHRYRNVKFGGPLAPYETQRSFLGRSSSGLVPPLAAKLASIQANCPGTVAISTVRHTRIAGTGRMSLHSQGKAVDVRGPYGCIYRELSGWPGGYSTDSARVRHIHISLDAEGGREMGLRFAHGRRSKHRVAAR